MAIELANHIYRDGEGVPVVLMNAYPVDHRMWDVCAKALADFADLNDVPDFPIWAPDMAGSGASPVPSDADSGPRMANGAYSEALDRLAGAYVDLIKAAGYEQAIWSDCRWAATWRWTSSACTPKRWPDWPCVTRWPRPTAWAERTD